MAGPIRRAKRQGFYLKQAVSAKGLSLRKVSKLSGIPYPMIIRLSKGQANPNWLTVVKLCEAMEVGPEEFYYVRWLTPPANNST